ncbi:MAG: hypothetical protein IPN73_15350 [Saprospiraceae bacterium]|nr:hypothetical protein [Saprospiraceae bacterium]MBK8851506.1 hypothetical protein [Saprospiraceae bacterium]
MAKNLLTKYLQEINVNVDVLLFKEEEIWVSYCPALNLSSYGDDEEDAKQAFGEVLSIFIEETTKKRTLDKELLKLGWQLQQQPTLIFDQPKMVVDKKLINKKIETYKEQFAVPVYA